MLQTYEIKKEVFFTFDDACGIIIKKLSDGRYLINQGNLYYAFTFEKLANCPRNDRFVTLPFITGVKDFPSKYAMKPKTFDVFIETFKKEFGIK